MLPDSPLTSPSRRNLLAIGSGLLAATMGGISPTALAATPSLTDGVGPTRFRTINVDGLDIFYREAGRPGAPVLLLLHGFPTSSRMFRNLIPMLADRYHVIAPDYPGFGHSSTPSRATFTYTHANLSTVMEALLDKLGVKSFAMYVMDFGGPIGYRLLLKSPDRVRAVVVQNTPIFGEPTDGPVWGPLVAYWQTGTNEARERIRSSLSPAAIREQYVAGTRDPTLIDPDNWTIDSALIARPEVDEIMLDLLYDIRNNRQTVADAKSFFFQHQDRVMIATGINDPLFPGAVMRPSAEMRRIAFHPIDSGHFALEDSCNEIAALTRDFLARRVGA
jgi:pimeloyl-ACP methyl ester carboxylesterase